MKIISIFEFDNQAYLIPTVMAESRRPPEIKTSRKYLYHLFLFITSIVIVVAISPREGKFRYEFEKGKPWLSASLIAPWDFAIVKPDNVVTAERDSILKNFSPYFKLDTEVERNKISEFDIYLNVLLKSYESESKPLDPMGFASIKRELNKILSEIYKKGVLETNELMPYEKLPAEITVISGRVGEQKQVSSLFYPEKRIPVCRGKKKRT